MVARRTLLKWSGTLPSAKMQHASRARASFALVCLAICFVGGANGLLPPCVDSNATCHIDRPTLKTIIVGDTGGEKGRPSAIQLQVAKTMVKLARKEGVDFIVNVGDNIYKKGAEKPDDPRFKSVFEEPYSALRVPWFMIAGNHDHAAKNVFSQVVYAPRSKKWVMPNLFYKAKYSFGVNSTKTTTAEYIFIDTQVACGIDVDRNGDVKLEAVPNRVEKKFIALDAEQQAWIESSLNESTADYLFVVGHYPMYTTNGGYSKCLAKKLNPLLQAHNVTAYIAGHHHSLQYFTPRNGHGPHYLISGAGARLGSNKPYAAQKVVNLAYRYTGDKNKTKGGFVSMTLGEKAANLTFYAGDLAAHVSELKPRF